MPEADTGFKSLVERVQAGERDYIARFSAKGADYRENPSLFVKSIDEAKRQIEAVVSDASLDRYDEVILPEAFRELLDVYLKNPIVISAHQHRLETGHSSVVGQTVKAWIDKDGLHVIIWFAETELGNEFWYLYKNKFQRAFSVGFVPLEWEDKTVEGKTVRTFTKVELLEISCVPVPANRNALSKSKRRKANFIADKIAQREAQSDEPAKDDAYGLIGLSKKDFSEQELAEFSEEELAVLGLSDLSGDEELDFEPDYGGIARGQSSTGFYDE